MHWSHLPRRVVHLDSHLLVHLRPAASTSYLPLLPPSHGSNLDTCTTRATASGHAGTGVEGQQDS